ncbi:MAG: protoporphyrinogen oxidase HemJ [Rhizobiaceae bacterium]
MSMDQNSVGRKAAMRAFGALAILALLTAALFWIDPQNLYLWIKAVHVMAVIAWMAGMFYLPRLFVYHADAPPGSEQSELFKLMEKRLLTVIINPAMMFAWVLGVWMAWDAFGFKGGWLHIKLLAVVALSAFHSYLSKAVRVFANDQNVKSARHWRMVNEIPTVLMIIIVIMVVVKPF